MRAVKWMASCTNTDRDGYPMYRRVMVHFSSIQDRHALYVEPLHYQYDWTVPTSTQ